MNICKIENFFLIGIMSLGLFWASGVQASDYIIDNTHSSIGFAVSHLMVSTTKGEFTDYSGTIKFDSQNLAESEIQVSIQSNSIDTRQEERDNHLRSADFLDTDNFPIIIFHSTKIEGQGTEYFVTGDLTIRGVTKTISIPCKIQGPIQSPFGAQVIGLEGQTMINRKDFGVAWNKTLDNGGVVVGEDVQIVVHVEAQQNTGEKS